MTTNTVSHAIVLALLCANAFTATGFAQTATISTIAGPGLPTNGSSAVTQPIDLPTAVAPDGAGGFYVTVTGQNRVYRVSAAGVVSVIAGTSSWGYSGDGGRAVDAQLRNPRGIAVDGVGNLFIADTVNNRIRKVDTSGVISTLAGSGAFGFAGDGGSAVSAQLASPNSVSVDDTGNLYIADTGNNRIRKVTPDGSINTVAGGGTLFILGTSESWPGTSVALRGPLAAAPDSKGNLYVADSGDNLVWRMNSNGMIQIALGDRTSSPALTSIWMPTDITVDRSDNVYIAEAGYDRIRSLTSPFVVAGPGCFDFQCSNLLGFVRTSGYSGDGGPATSARFSLLSVQSGGVAADRSGNLFVADSGNNRVRKINVAGLIGTVAGADTNGFRGDGGPANSALFAGIAGLATDAEGNLYISDSGNARIRKMSANGLIDTFAGSGTPGYGGDGGPARSALLASPSGIAMDNAGNLYIADMGNDRIRKVSPSGVMSTVAGNGTPGFQGDGGPATSAQLSSPTAVAVATGGTLFLVDSKNGRIRKVSADGVITTVAGGGTDRAAENVPATSAQLNPIAVAVDKADNLYIADRDDTFVFRVRKVDSNGTISTFAGYVRAVSSRFGFTRFVLFGELTGVVVDAQGNLYVSQNNSVLVTASGGLITYVAGVGDAGYGGDGGPLLSARLSARGGIALDSAGNLYIGGDGRIRKVENNTASPTVTAFTISDRGGATRSTVGGSGTNINVGYAQIQPDNGRTAPSGLAIFGLRQNGVLVTEAGLAATPELIAGRIYAEISADATVNTGLAIANPNDQIATINFRFTDAAGEDFGSGSLAILPKSQIAKFLDQAPFNAPRSIQGSFSFTSTVGVAVIALRGVTNERGEFLITTLPVIDTSVVPGRDAVFLPHFADGGGWRTQVILVNPTDAALSGIVQFGDTAGMPASVDIGTQTSSSFQYSIPRRASQKFVTSGSAAAVISGWVRITPGGGQSAPIPQVVFSFRPGTVTISEAGVTANSGNAFRMYAESSWKPGTPNNIQTGVAIVNTSALPATVTFELTQFDGTPLGIPASVNLPALGQTAKFVGELFPALPEIFRGFLRISSSANLAIVGLRGRYNERSEFLVTTTPPSNEAAEPSAAPLFFPHFADSGGYTTDFVLFSGGSGQSSSGKLQLFPQ